MRRRRLVNPFAALGAVGVLALASCGSADPTYYRLAVWPGAVQAAAFQGGGTQVVEIRTPTVASYLDRDYIVSKTEDYRLRLAGNDAWAEPIADLIGRTLAGDIAQRVPGSNAYVEGSVAGGTPTIRVDLDVGRFDKDADGSVVVHATLKVRDVADGTARTQMLVLADPAPSAGTAGFVASLSALLGKVADQAAVDIRTMPALPVAAAPDGAAPID